MTSTALRTGDRPAEHSADPRELAANPRVRPAGRASGPQLVMAVIGIAGVAVLALGAFGVSYPGGRQIALSAGVSPMVAGLYPVIIDAMLVVACVSALALRGAAWWMQLYAWLAVIVLVAAIGFIEAAHAAGITLSHRPAAAVMAALPWGLLLLGLGLWLSMLGHQRRVATMSPAERAESASWWPWNTGLEPGEPKALSAQQPDVTILDVRPDPVDGAEGAPA